MLCFCVSYSTVAGTTENKKKEGERVNPASLFFFLPSSLSFLLPCKSETRATSVTESPAVCWLYLMQSHPPHFICWNVHTHTPGGGVIIWSRSRMICIEAISWICMWLDVVVRAKSCDWPPCLFMREALQADTVATVYTLHRRGL